MTMSAPRPAPGCDYDDPTPAKGDHGDHGSREDPDALFARARAWLYQAGEPGWIADAFGHWVIAEVAPRGPVPEPLSGLWAAWSYHQVPRQYRARHGARLAGAPPWQPGQSLPSATEAAAVPRR